MMVNAQGLRRFRDIMNTEMAHPMIIGRYTGSQRSGKPVVRARTGAKRLYEALA